MKIRSIVENGYEGLEDSDEFRGNSNENRGYYIWTGGGLWGQFTLYGVYDTLNQALERAEILSGPVSVTYGEDEEVWDNGVDPMVIESYDSLEDNDEFADNIVTLHGDFICHPHLLSKHPIDAIGKWFESVLHEPPVHIFISHKEIPITNFIQQWEDNGGIRGWRRITPTTPAPDQLYDIPKDYITAAVSITVNDVNNDITYLWEKLHTKPVHVIPTNPPSYLVAL